MATAPTHPLVTMEEYVKTSYEPECEYLEGVLEPKTLPTEPHSFLQYMLITSLHSHAAGHGYIPLPELRIRVSPGKFRVPDVTLTSKGWFSDKSEPPLAIFEIISPDDRVGQLIEKTRDYHALGVRNIIAVDPQQRAVLTADEHGGLGARVPGVVTLTLPNGPAITINFDELFAQLPPE